jgi:hypothetical protein
MDETTRNLFDFSDLETAEDLAIDEAKDALRFNTLGGNVLRQGGVVYFLDCVAVRLDSNGEPILS